jgi:CheY-like chemotaxis protein
VKDLGILVVDDQPAIVELLAEYLQARGCVVSTASQGREALARLDEGGVDLLITDLKLPGVDGLQLLDHAGTLEPPAGVILMTAYSGPELAAEAMRRGALDLLTKPFRLAELREVLERCVLELGRRRAGLTLYGIEDFLTLAGAAEASSAHALADALVSACLAEPGVRGAALLIEQPACGRLVEHQRAGEGFAGLDLESAEGVDLPGLGRVVLLGSVGGPARRAAAVYGQVLELALRRIRAEEPGAFAETFLGHAEALGELPEAARRAWAGGFSFRDLQRAPGLAGEGPVGREAAELVLSSFVRADGQGALEQAVDERGPQLAEAAWWDLATRVGASLPLLDQQAARERLETLRGSRFF